MNLELSSKGYWQLRRYSERYAQSATARQPLLLLPGWSCDSRIFDWIIPGLAQHFVIYSAEIRSLPEAVDLEGLSEDLSVLISQEFTQPAMVLGWSLGGNIALELARINSHVSGVLLLATSPAFVASEQIPSAMAREVFDGFYQSVATNKTKGLKRFDLLQIKGHQSPESQQLNSRLPISSGELKRSLQDYRQLQADTQASYPALSDDELLRGLSILSGTSQVATIQSLLARECELRFIFAENDALLNVQVADDLLKCLSGKLDQATKQPFSIEVLEGASHLCFLTHTESVYSHLMAMQTQQLQKAGLTGVSQSVAESFSQAAARYDSASAIQKTIAAKLLNKVKSLEFNQPQSERYIVDAGCGTGLWTAKLCEHAKHVTGVDMASGMLDYAKAKNTQVPHWLQADVRAMPLVPEQTHLIFSSLAIQWCDDIAGLLQHWYKLLSPGGYVVLATLASNTLHELSQSFLSLDDDRHVNQFYHADELQSIVDKSSFKSISFDNQVEVQPYDNLLGLLHDLKDIGAQTVIEKNEGNVQKAEVKPLTKAKLNQLKLSYEQYRQADGMLPASYDVVYMVLQKPC